MDRRSALALIGAGLTIAPGRAEAADPAIRVGMIPIEASMQPEYATERGYVAQSGLTLDLQSLPNGPAMIAAIVGGSLDLADVNWISILQARERGVPLVVVAPAVLYTANNPTTYVTVPLDSPAQTAKDLNGKTIAVDALGSLTQLGAEFWLDKKGGDLASVHFIEVPFNDMAQSLTSHRVDAAVFTEPQATRMRASTRVLATPYDVLAASFPTSAWVASPAWVAANPDRARRFATLMYRTAKWANANRPLTADMLARFAHLDRDLVLSMHRATYSERNEPRLLLPLIDIALKYGAIKKPVNLDDLFASTLSA